VVCGWTDCDRGGEVLQVGDGAEGEKWRSVEFGSIELVRVFYVELWRRWKIGYL
jgi:hypothetical protein